ncbi:MAG: hypothetical protein M1823_002494 [Watsoniomyces obsoletus]|nr:MAG: hypothetical protein M1823_002494 [Watsoniomyces obsoletus]
MEKVRDRPTPIIRKSNTAPTPSGRAGTEALKSFMGSQRTSSPAMRKDLLEEMANWYASQERELPKELGEMIKWQCREDELNQIRHATPWEKWPERPVWAKAEKAIQRDWEERYGEEIAKEDPENTLLANYYKKAELGLSHLPQALTELKSGAQKNAPVILQAAVANMKRFDAAAALKKVKIKPRKGPILL